MYSIIRHVVMNIMSMVSSKHIEYIKYIIKHEVLSKHIKYIKCKIKHMVSYNIKLL